MSWPQRPSVLPALNFYMEEGWTTVVQQGPRPRWREYDQVDVREIHYPSHRLLNNLGYRQLENGLELLSLLSSDSGERRLLRRFHIKEYTYKHKTNYGYAHNMIPSFMPIGYGKASTIQFWDLGVKTASDTKARLGVDLVSDVLVVASPLDWWLTPEVELMGPSIKGRPEEFARVIGLTVGFHSGAGKIIRPWSM